jgi:hypothetical protein
MRILRWLARWTGRLALALLQTLYVTVIGGFVPLLAFGLVAEGIEVYHAPQWLAAVAFFGGLVAFGVMLGWLRRARRRARLAWHHTPPPSPPGQPLPEPVEQWPEMAVPARVRRLPDGTVIIEPTRGSRVA